VDAATINRVAEAKIPKGNRWPVRKSLKALPEIIADDEEVTTMGSGRYESSNGLVVVTDRRVVFVNVGFGHRRVEDFQFDRISSVQHDRGLMSGKVIITVAGNRAVIDNIAPKERADDIADLVRSRLAQPTTPVAPATPAAEVAGVSVADEIRKLMELRDLGALSNEEFEEQKAKLLNG
jgi:hypothetical protein